MGGALLELFESETESVLEPEHSLSASSIDSPFGLPNLRPSMLELNFPPIFA